MKSARPASNTPMMAQYLAIREAHPGYLLFYRMGDFYELFFEDAVKAAGALDIALTKRGRHDGDDIPMAGVPVRAHEAYLERLIRKGFKVAICEQTEDPAEARKRGGGSVVARDVVRLVTPGTLTEDALLEARRHNYLAVLAEANGAHALAWADISTGDFRVESVEDGGLPVLLARIEPSELVLPEAMLDEAAFDGTVTPLPAARFDSENARRRLLEAFNVATLEGFGRFDRAQQTACGVLIDYLELTQKGRLPRLEPPRPSGPGRVLEIDPATRRNLELTATLAGERRGSLLATIDRTRSAGGGRLLAAWLASPLTDPAAIAARHDAVDRLCREERLRRDLAGRLARAPDIERSLSRLGLGRGGPRDLAAIRDALALAGEIAALFDAPPPLLDEACAALRDHDATVAALTAALGPDLPLAARDGGFVAPGYDDELDRLRSLRDDSRRTVAGLQARYAAETGASALKIRHNNILGYFIEVTQAASDRLLADDAFIHRQTMANSMRFTTVELGGLEARIAGAAEQALAAELAIFERLTALVREAGAAIAAAAQALALLDATSGLAALAVECGWSRPVVDDSLAFEIEGGRHPVVEAALDEPFVANGCDLSPDRRLWLVTGPNMAGKSTFLRQNALIAILAQMGSFVPTDRAHIGAVDRLFSRVGASDDLARGRSTFMVEMVETAAILNQAGERSLVILDEIGRGTATFDGLSIAWAVVEQLHEACRCRALFATHYHELTLLAGKLDRLALRTMRVKEWQGAVVFLHEVAPGAADRSYGIHVARLAGLPGSVVERAEEVLRLLETGEQGSAIARLADDLPLFAAARNPQAEPEPSEAEQVLAALDPDALTPREALERLYELKRLLG